MVAGSNLHISAAKDSFSEMLETLPEEASKFGFHFLERISPPEWELEWSLPNWLGEPLKVDDSTIQAVTRANVYGLVYVCLSDDLLDNDIDEANFSNSQIVKIAAYEHWLNEYRQLFKETSSDFWPSYDSCMDEWHESLNKSCIHPDIDFDTYLRKNYLELAHRAAPLKTCCIAICVMTNRLNFMPPLVEALDHLNTASVLFDQADDWTEDLEAGRYNTFIHYTSNHSQIPQNRTLHRRFIYREMWHEKAFLPYFQIADNHMNSAIQILKTLPFSALTVHAIYKKKVIQQYRITLEEEAKTELRRITKILFPC